jgi:hypothetical protein
MPTTVEPWLANMTDGELLHRIWGVTLRDAASRHFSMKHRWDALQGRWMDN